MTCTCGHFWFEGATVGCARRWRNRHNQHFYDGYPNRPLVCYHCGDTLNVDGTVTRKEGDDA